MSIKPTTIPPKSLSQAIISTDTTFIVTDILGWDGNALTSSDFGTIAYGAFLSADRTILEIFEWDPATIADSSISFVTRGLDFTGGTTAVTANKLDWPAGTTVLIGSDTPQLLNSFVSAAYLDTDANMAANSDVKIPSQKAAKSYADALAIAGSPDSTTTTKGISKMSVAPASASAPIAVGDNDPRVPTQGENNAAAGSTGTPSSSNKFVTETDPDFTNTMKLTGDQTAAGVKTFTSIPVLPASDPTTSNQAARKAYADTLIAETTGSVVDGSVTISYRKRGKLYYAINLGNMLPQSLGDTLTRVASVIGITVSSSGTIPMNTGLNTGLLYWNGSAWGSSGTNGSAINWILST